MLALFVIALGIFLLPFAFPTPPPIVTRFKATQLFSPDGDGRRDVARVNIRLHEASDVTVEIQKDGEPVVTLIDGRARRPRGFWSTEDWAAATTTARAAPAGRHLRHQAGARAAGDKQFNTHAQDRHGHRRRRGSAKMTVDVGDARRQPGRGECRVALTAARPGVAGAREAPRPAGERRGRAPAGAAPRARRRDASAGCGTGSAPTAREVPPGLYVIGASLSDAARNRTSSDRAPAGWAAWPARPVPCRPAPARDRWACACAATDGDAHAALDAR